MGRVASRRKLKQCDPFFKGTRVNDRRKKNSSYDLPPTKSSKRKKKRINRSIQQDRIEKEVLGDNLVKEMSVEKNKLVPRKQGESYKQFCKRMSADVKKIIRDETKGSTNRTAKKKEFFAKKKQKEKRKRMSEQERYEEDYLRKGPKDNSDEFAGVENVRFGDRYDAPPQLNFKSNGRVLKRVKRT